MRIRDPEPPPVGFQRESWHENLLKARRSGDMMAGERIVLCCAGEWPSEQIWAPLIEAADRVVGVDGGTDEAIGRGIEVSVAVGDFDSIINSDIKRHPLPYQHSSDLAKALLWAHQNGASEVDVVGVSGGRTDHQLAAFAALIEAPSDLEIRLHFDDFISLRCDDEISLHLEEGIPISIFAFTPCAHITLSGVEYPLEEQPLAFSTRGLHNTALGGEVELKSDGEIVILLGRTPE